MRVLRILELQQSEENPLSPSRHGLNNEPDWTTTIAKLKPQEGALVHVLRGTGVVPWTLDVDKPGKCWEAVRAFEVLFDNERFGAAAQSASI